MCGFLNSIFDFLSRFLFSISFSSTLSSVQSLMTDSLQPHGLQHTRLTYPSSSPRACSNWCLLNCWCYPTISSSVVPFSSCFQSFPTSGSFPMSQFFTSAGQSIGISASASVLPVYIQDWSPLGWTGWISLQCSLLHLHSGSCLMSLKVVTLTIKDVFRGKICKRWITQIK